MIEVIEVEASRITWSEWCATELWARSKLFYTHGKCYGVLYRSGVFVDVEVTNVPMRVRLRMMWKGHSGDDV
jgi:hypothetical protein